MQRGVARCGAAWRSTARQGASAALCGALAPNAARRGAARFDKSCAARCAVHLHHVPR